MNILCAWMSYIECGASKTSCADKGKAIMGILCVYIYFIFCVYVFNI